MKRMIVAAVVLLPTVALADAQTNYSRVLVQLRPTAQYTFSGTTCTGLQWLDLVQTAPTCAEMDAAVAALPSADAAEAARQAAIKSDAGRLDLQSRLKAATPAQIDTYVNTNITDLASAKLLLAKIIKLIALDARQ